MKVIEVNADGVLMSLSNENLSLLISAIGESLEALDDWEFQTRTGAEKDDFLSMLDELIALRKQVAQKSE